MRVAKVSRFAARRLEGFRTNAALKRGDVAIDAPVLISGCRRGGDGCCGCGGGDGGCGRSRDGGSGGCTGGRCRQALPRDGLTFFNRTTGFALVIPKESLGARLAHDRAGCADKKAVLGVRVTQVSRLSARRLESFAADAALQRSDVAIDAPVLISRCCGGNGGSCGGGGGRGRRALPWDRLTFPDGTAGFAFVIPEKSLGAGLAEDLVAEREKAEKDENGDR